MTDTNAKPKIYIKALQFGVVKKVKSFAHMTKVEDATLFPFGAVMSDQVLSGYTNEQNKYKYQSKERDIETGYDYFEARYYDPNVARFMQADPMGEKFTHTNFYTGMDNNPIRVIDPTGEEVVLVDGTDKEANKQLRESYNTWTKTKEGQAFLEKYGSSNNKILIRIMAKDMGKDGGQGKTQLNQKNSTEEKLVLDMNINSNELSGNMSEGYGSSDGASDPYRSSEIINHEADAHINGYEEKGNYIYEKPYIFNNGTEFKGAWFDNTNQSKDHYFYNGPAGSKAYDKNSKYSDIISNEVHPTSKAASYHKSVNILRKQEIKGKQK